MNKNQLNDAVKTYLSPENTKSLRKVAEEFGVPPLNSS